MKKAKWDEEFKDLDLQNFVIESVCNELSIYFSEEDRGSKIAECKNKLLPFIADEAFIANSIEKKEAYMEKTKDDCVNYAKYIEKRSSIPIISSSPILEFEEIFDTCMNYRNLDYILDIMRGKALNLYKDEIISKMKIENYFLEPGVIEREVSFYNNLLERDVRPTEIRDDNRKLYDAINFINKGQFNLLQRNVDEPYGKERKDPYKHPAYLLAPENRKVDLEKLIA